MDIIEAEYDNTGGNCWCMFAHVKNCEELGKGEAWLIGSVDCYGSPLIDFYATEKAREENEGQYADGYITWATVESKPWTLELWKEMFRYVFAHQNYALDIARGDYQTYIENL